MNSSHENVRVFVRCRPLLSSEQSHSTCVQPDAASNSIFLTSTDPHTAAQKDFIYDGVFDCASSQEQVYEECAFNLVDNVLEGYNATIFAYGQTGSGKTFSMMGNPDSESGKGIIPRSFEQIMGLINGNSEGRTFFITASFLEIYNEEIHDLLKRTADKKPVKCELRENPEKGFFVKDLSQVVVHSANELMQLLNNGNKQRAVGETKMNEKSSRSHSIFNIRVESSFDLGPGKKPRISMGKLNLVDLAGSERQNKTHAQNERFKEAIKINLSLSALGNVISALADGKTAHTHIPYRDSKLTRLLQDSLGGNAKTTMLANINPSAVHYDETLGTLRYASRTKMIKNKPKVNEDPKDALIRTYLDEIQKLKEMLEKGMQVNPSLINNPMSQQIYDEEMLKQKKEQENMEIERALKEIEFQKNKEYESFKEKELREKEKIMVELKEKEEGFEKLRTDKERLETLLMEKEQALLQGHQVQEDKEKIDLMRKRIIKHKKEKDLLLQEKKKQEEELRNVERKYANIQEELIALRKSNKELYSRFSTQKTEIEDLQKEHEREKENLLDTIREHEKEMTFFDELINQIMSREEVIKVRGQAFWSETLNKYKIPPYLFKDKQVKFPNLTSSVGIDLTENRKMLGENGEEEDERLPSFREKVTEMPKEYYFPEEKKDKEGFLATQRIKNNSFQKHDRKIKVKPVAIPNPNDKPKEIQPPPVFKRPSYKSVISMEDMTSPSLGERTKMKKEYLKALDSMIDTYTEKYGKDKVIVPQNLSMTYTLSFTDFKDLEKDLDTQMAKAKRNLNTLLEPLNPQKSESVIQELVQGTSMFKNNAPIERNSALINKRVLPSPKNVALSSFNKITPSGGLSSRQPYIIHRKNESENSANLFKN